MHKQLKTYEYSPQGDCFQYYTTFQQQSTTFIKVILNLRVKNNIMKCHWLMLIVQLQRQIAFLAIIKRLITYQDTHQEANIFHYIPLFHWDRSTRPHIVLCRELQCHSCHKLLGMQCHNHSISSPLEYRSLEKKSCKKSS